MSKIPKRVRTPDVYTYVLIDRSKFEEIINSTQAVIKEQLGYSTDVTIRVTGFDDEFENVEDFVKTLSGDEWQDLKRIDVYIRPQDNKEFGYEYTLDLSFGGYTFESGLKVSYGKNVTDIQKIAVQQQLDLIFKRYSRNIPLSASKTAGIVAGVVGAILIYSTLSWINGRSSEQIVNILSLVVPFSLFLIYFVGLIAHSLHNKFIPYFEATDDSNNTKIKKLTKNVGIFVAVVSFVSAVLGILQWIT